MEAPKSTQSGNCSKPVRIRVLPLARSFERLISRPIRKSRRTKPRCAMVSMLA
ncbi:hypothetical protein D3C86_1856550 [compost metagenome]